jgi:hypothetical protein
MKPYDTGAAPTRNRHSRRQRAPKPEPPATGHDDHRPDRLAWPSLLDRRPVTSTSKELEQTAGRRCLEDGEPVLLE